jgi:uncharacterized membrane protein
METINPTDQLLDDIQKPGGSNFSLDGDGAKKELEESHSAYSNLPIKVLSILGGLLATLSFIGFLALARILESESGMTILGVIFIGAAVASQRLVKHIALDTSMITFYVAGCVLLAMGLSMFTGHDNLRPVLFMFISLLTIALCDGFMLVLLAVLVFNASIFSFIPINSAYGLMPVPIIFMGIGLLLLTLYEPQIIAFSPKMNRLYKGLQTGFFFSFAGGLMTAAQNTHYDLQLGNLYTVSIFNSIALLGLAFKLIGEFKIGNKIYLLLIFIFCLLFIAATFYAPFVSGGLLLLLLSYHFGQKTETGISIILFAYFICQYYYDLRCTLLVKSGILFFSGIVFIAAWLFFYRQLKQHEKI